MKKTKRIITGILSGAVFFMAVQVGVAKETAVEAPIAEKTEMLKSVEALALGKTVEELNMKLNRFLPTIGNANGIKRTQYYQYLGSPGDDDWNQPGKWSPAPSAPDCPDGETNICGANTDNLSAFLGAHNSTSYTDAVTNLPEIVRKP